MMKEREKILLRRKHLIIENLFDTTHKQSDEEKALVVSMLKNVQSLGFTFSQILLNDLFHYTKNQIETFYKDLVPELKVLVGADVKYEPMYPNFPNQVMEMSDVELFINAILHYWSYGTIMPEYEKEERLPLIESENKYTVIGVGTHKDVMEIFANLLSSKTSISVQDKDDIMSIIATCEDYVDYMPDEIPLKENIAFISNVLMNSPNGDNSFEAIKKYFKTATDVLRFIVAMSNGDISLAKPTKFRSMKRKERRLIMNLLANCNSNILEDMYRYHYEWIRVGEVIHPSEYKSNKYNYVNKCFNTLRNEHKPLMFNGKVQNAILKKATCELTDILKTRPGEFARKLDKVIRDAGNNANYVLNAFEDKANDVSTTVLLQVRQHFIGRMADEKLPVRVFFPKGNLARAKAIDNNIPNINKNICEDIINICNRALIHQYATKEPMGKVYIDEEFKNFLVPFSQRSASKAIKTIVRGSQIPIHNDTKAIRGFIWWTNTDNNLEFYSRNRVDIDLSAAIFDTDWNYIEHISYTHLRSNQYKAYHSGDITNGGPVNDNGVAEFIDIDIDSVCKYGARYVVYQVYSYNGQKFSVLPNCRFGWMERNDVNSGEIFEPSTVEMKIDLTADSRTAIPVIFDCVDKKFIWCDMNLSLSNCHRGGVNFESNISGVTATCYAMTHLNKPNLYDLVYYNAIARGNITTNRNEADIIFSNDTTIPYEVIEINDEKTGTIKREIRDKTEVPIITAFDVDYFVGKLL